MLRKAGKMDKLNKIELGNRITKLRESKHKTQSDIANLLELKSHQQVSYLENGNENRNMSLSQLITLAKYFNVSTDYLLGLSDAPTSDKDLQFISDYTGLSPKIIALLKNKNEESKENKYIYYHIEILEKLISLYFEKLQLLISNYIVYGKTLKSGIEDYKIYLKKKRNDAYALIEKAKSSGNFKGGNSELNEFYLNFADDIIECEIETIRNDLTASNSDLFELQETFISFIKGLSNIDELKDECYQLINDNSVFNDIHKMFSDIYQIDNTTKEGESNEEKES